MFSKVYDSGDLTGVWTDPPNKLDTTTHDLLSKILYAIGFSDDTIK